MEDSIWKSKDTSHLYGQIRSPKFQLVYPDLLARLESQKAHSLLDYGCGAGLFLKEFSSQLGIEQVGFDISNEMLDQATENCSATAHTSFTNTLDKFKREQFDAITKTAVWMVWNTDQECVENLQSIRRLLQPNGRLYAAVTHPCFRDRAFAGNILHLNMEKYLEQGVPYQAEIKDNQKSMQVTNYHWSLSQMSSQLKRSNLRIEDIHEYPDIAENAPGSPWMLIIAAPSP